MMKKEERERFVESDTATTEIYNLALHDALRSCAGCSLGRGRVEKSGRDVGEGAGRSTWPFGQG